MVVWLSRYLLKSLSGYANFRWLSEYFLSEIVTFLDLLTQPITITPFERFYSWEKFDQKRQNHKLPIHPLRSHQSPFFIPSSSTERGGLSCIGVVIFFTECDTHRDSHVLRDQPRSTTVRGIKSRGWASCFKVSVILICYG